MDLSVFYFYFKEDESKILGGCGYVSKANAWIFGNTGISRHFACNALSDKLLLIFIAPNVSRRGKEGERSPFLSRAPPRRKKQFSSSHPLPPPFPRATISSNWNLVSVDKRFSRVISVNLYR